MSTRNLSRSIPSAPTIPWQISSCWPCRAFDLRPLTYLKICLYTLWLVELYKPCSYYNHSFITEHYQTAEILLEPSQVSVTAADGAVIGILSTVSQNPGETFLYELVNEAQLPFRVTGNTLLVAKKDGLDFQVTSSEEALLPISIISKGSVSGIVRESFYVRVVGEY